LLGQVNANYFFLWLRLNHYPEPFIAKVLGNIQVVRWRRSTILLLAGEKPIHPNDANMNRIAVALKTLPTPR
jgi:hypothetical protein